MSNISRSDLSTASMNRKHTNILEKHPKGWMVRKCELYYDEMKECQSYSSQLHQYYVYGEKQSCQNWVDNYADCRKWSTDQDMEALNRIISREEERVATRLKAHADNNVWQRRDKPPAPREWANDLPDNLVAACERSKLASVYDEFGDPVSIDGSTVRTMNNLLPRCSIM